MDPNNNQPWTPKPYEPARPQEEQQPAHNQQPPAHDPYAWQRAAANDEQPARHDEYTASQQPVAQVPFQPVPWQPPAPSAQATTPAPGQPFPTQQFGGPMSELPPLAPNTSGVSPEDKKQRNRLWLVILAAVIVPALIIGTYVGLKVKQDSRNQQAAQQKEQLNYNLAELQTAAKAPLTAASVAKLDKTNTFYTVFKQAATKQIVATKWGVYYSAQQNDTRGDQYSLYDTAIDYQSKKFNYDENSYSNIGTYQVRCIGGAQYNYVDNKLTASPSWQPASDSADCKLNTVAMHLNDGFNAGGLTSDQADTFIRKIKGYGMVTVNGMSLAANKGKQYLKLDVTVTPQKQGSIYQGMQLFMNAFQATGLDAGKLPYTFFGAGGEGAHIQYYVDVATQLPVYAKVDSTAIYSSAGKPQITTSWSHRAIEYVFPAAITDRNLDTHTPISFTAWPDH